MPSVASRGRRPVTLRDYQLWRVCLWGVLLIGPLFIFVGIHGNYRDRPSLQWPVVPGTVMQSEWWFHRGKHSYYDVTVTYSYMVNDRRYMGHKVKLWNPNLRGDRDTVKTFVTDHHVRSVVDAYYAPQFPENAVLIPGADEVGNRFGIWSGSIISVLAAWLVFRGQSALAKIIAKKKAEQARAPRIQPERVAGLPHAFATYEPDFKRKLNCFPDKECLLDALGHDGEGIQDWKADDRVIDSSGREYRLVRRPEKKCYDIEPTGEMWSYEKLLEVAMADARLLKKDPDALRRRAGNAPTDKRMAILMQYTDDLPAGPQWAVIGLGVFLLLFFLAVVFGAYKVITWLQK